MSKILDLVLAGTPPQFDNDTSLATTEFVTRSQGNLSGIKNVSTPYVVVPADAGKYLVVSGAGTVTLNGGVLPPGCTVSITPAITSTAIEVASNVGFSFGSVERLPALVLKNDECVTLVAQGTAARMLVLNGALRNSPDFDSAAVNNGHFWKLPSGLVIQRGTGTNTGSAGVVVPCPYAKTGQVLFATAIVASAAAGYLATVSDLTATGFTVHTWQNATTRGAASFSWMALTLGT